MGNNQRNNKENPLFSWILTLIMLAAFWPVGLYLLFRMLTVGSITSPRKPDPKQPIDVRAAEVREPSPKQPARQPQRSQAQKPQARPAAAAAAPYASSRAPITIGKKWGNGLIIAGAIVTGLFGFVLLNQVIDLISYGYYSYLLREMVYMAGLTATGLVLLFCGIGRRKKATRYRRYLTLIGQRESLSIDTLAKAMPVSYRRACDDLQDMLERGFLPAGYVDAIGRRIVFSDGGIREDPVPPKPKPASTKPDAASDDAILSAIRAINDDIDDVVMSQKIDRIEEITGKILDFQRKNPSASADLRNFLDYYLPTTLKILRSYAQLEEQGIEGENISSTKFRIEGMMDKVVSGFENRLDKLFQSDALDISSDVQVLEQMLKKDGLASDELKIEL